jgi:hypothetical protein
MKSTPQDASTPAVLTEDDRLVQLELRVAQRADELSQESGGGRGRDLEHWLRAEHEIFERCRAQVSSGVAVAES